MRVIINLCKSTQDGLLPPKALTTSTKFTIEPNQIFSSQTKYEVHCLALITIIQTSQLQNMNKQYLLNQDAGLYASALYIHEREN